MDTLKKKQPKKIHFKIDSIRKINHFENHFLDLDLEKSILKKHKFNFGVRFKIDDKNGTIEVQIQTNFYIDVDSKKINLFGIESSHKFKIKEFNKYILIPECDEYDIPDGLMITFLGIAISGTRSMLATMNSTPEYNKLLLPLINPADILKFIKEKST